MLKELYALWSLSQKIVKILSTTHHKGTVGVGGEIGLYSFFNLGAKGGRVLNAMPQPLYPGKRPDTHWRGLDGPQEKVCTSLAHRKRRGPIGDEARDLPARSQSLHRLCHCGPLVPTKSRINPYSKERQPSWHREKYWTEKCITLSNQVIKLQWSCNSATVKK